jgi:hypothetical protein
VRTRLRSASVAITLLIDALLALPMAPPGFVRQKGYFQMLRLSTRAFHRQAAHIGSSGGASVTAAPPAVLSPYAVSRTASGNLPVYTDVKNANRILVSIRNVQGDAPVRHHALPHQLGLYI